MREKLTASLIAKLQVPEGKKQVKIHYTEVCGLCVRLMASGLARFVFIRRPKGSNAPKEITVGRCGEMSVDQARHQARRLAVEFSAPDYLSSKASRDAVPNFRDAVHQYDELALSKRSTAYRQKRLERLDVTLSESCAP